MKGYIQYKIPTLDTTKLVKEISEYFPKLEWEVDPAFKHCLVIRTIPHSKLDITFDYNYNYKLWRVSSTYNNIDLLPDIEDGDYIERFSSPDIKNCAKALKESIENLFTLKDHV